jgi:hypothetical protein
MFVVTVCDHDRRSHDMALSVNREESVEKIGIKGQKGPAGRTRICAWFFRPGPNHFHPTNVTINQTP